MKNISYFLKTANAKFILKNKLNIKSCSKQILVVCVCERDILLPVRYQNNPRFDKDKREKDEIKI